jgi:hypothetical protein
MRRTVALALSLVFAGPRRDLPAQTEISLGAGVGTVRSSAGATVTAVTVGSGWRSVAPRVFASALGAVAAFPDGQWNVQLRTDLWLRVAPRGGNTGLALAPALAGTALPGDERAGSALLLAEWFAAGGARGVAVAAGPVIGAIRSMRPVAATRARARAWLQTGAVQYVLTVEPTRLRGDWYADIAGSATLEHRRVAATAAAVARMREGTSAYASGSVAASWRVAGRVWLEGAAAGFPADPFLGFPRAWTANAGVRVTWGSRPADLVAPLTALRRGDSIVVRVRVRGAVSVALAGDWSDWTPHPLRRAGAALWEGTLALAAGTYRFSLLIDGARWMVPPGIATVPDGFGGTAGLLVVPPSPRTPER